MNRRDYYWLSVLICVVAAAPRWAILVLLGLNLALALFAEYTEHLRRKVKDTKGSEP